MPTVLWALLCKKAERNQYKELDIIGEFIEARFKTFPVTPPPIFLVARLRFPDYPVIYSIETRVSDPDGRILSFDAGTELESKNESIIFIREIKGMFPTPGVYSFDLLIKGKLLHSINLTMSF